MQKHKFKTKKDVYSYIDNNEVLDIFKEKDHYIVTVEDIDTNSELYSDTIENTGSKKESCAKEKRSPEIKPSEFTYPRHLAQQGLTDCPSVKQIRYLLDLASKYDKNATDRIKEIESKQESANWVSYFKKKYNLQKSHWKTDEPSEKQINYLINLVDRYQPIDFPDISSIKTKKQASNWINKIKTEYE